MRQFQAASDLEPAAGSILRVSPSLLSLSWVNLHANGGQELPLNRVACSTWSGYLSPQLSSFPTVWTLRHLSVLFCSCSTCSFNDRLTNSSVQATFSYISHKSFHRSTFYTRLRHSFNRRRTKFSEFKLTAQGACSTTPFSFSLTWAYRYLRVHQARKFGMMSPTHVQGGFWG
jgi:hypothetical protein